MDSILCTSRSGSENLLNYLSNVISVKKENSPFSKDKKITFDVLKEDSFYKFIISDTPDDLSDMFQFGEKIIEKSNICILLDRKDLNKQAESYAFKKYKYANDVSKYHIKEKYEKMEKDVMDNAKKELKEQKKVLRKLSKKYNKKIYYYEDIFYGNGIDELSEELKVNINTNFKNLFLSDFNKERVTNTKESLI